MQLLDLCNEILLTMINILPDEALIKFSCTCCKICKLAESQLKGRKYIALYSKIELDAGGFRWKHPIQIMKAIDQDPVIAQHLKWIHYSPPPSYPPTWLQLTNDGIERYEIETDIDKLPFLGDPEKQKWKEAAREGLDCLSNISFIILLSSCTNVTTLTLKGLYDLPKYFNPLICYLCESSHRSLQDLNATYNSSYLSNQLLPGLTTLELCCSPNEDGLSLRNDFTLFAIPTLRTLYLDTFVAEHYEVWSHWPWTLKYNRSCSCETVEVFLGILTPQNLISLIKNLPQLKTLKYSHFYKFHCPPSFESPDEFVDLCWQLGRGLLRKRSLRMTFGQDREGQLMIKFDKLNEVEEVTEPLRKEMEGISCRFADGAMITND